MKYRLASQEDIENGIETLYFFSTNIAGDAINPTYLMHPRPGEITMGREMLLNGGTMGRIGWYSLVKSRRKTGGFCLSGGVDWFAYVEDKPMVLDWSGDDDDCI